MFFENVIYSWQQSWSVTWSFRNYSMLICAAYYFYGKNIEDLFIHDSLMNRKFKITAFIWKLNCCRFFFTFDQFNVLLVNKTIHKKKNFLAVSLTIQEYNSWIYLSHLLSGSQSDLVRGRYIAQACWSPLESCWSEWGTPGTEGDTLHNQSQAQVVYQQILFLY